MPHVVIIGAGPAGLELSQRLYKAGVRDQIIFDPRAGKYVRPGHINLSTYLRGVRNVLGETSSNIFSRAYHIKDLERVLYAEVKRLGIVVENKKFIGLHQDAKNPGVIVHDIDGAEEIIHADYVFDCTGGKRHVISSVNAIVPETPFRMIEMGKTVIKKHLIAYVNMDEESFNRFTLNASQPDTSDPAAFAESLLKLRALGWKECKFPRSYGKYFGKSKACLYFCAPDHLPEEKIDEWIQTVLECYTTPIQFQRIPRSSKYADKPYVDKPRVVLFDMNSQAIHPVSYQGNNLPMVIAVGDAQIDFDYALAHGIEDGFERIDLLMKHIEILNNHIAYFDAEDFLSILQKQLKNHTVQVIDAQEWLRKNLENAIESAFLKLTTAALLPAFQMEKDKIQALIDETKARSSYISVRNKMVQLEQSGAAPELAVLYDIHDHLLKAADLPIIFNEELQQVSSWFNKLIVFWRAEGNQAHKRKQYDSAIVAYKKALEVCQAKQSEENTLQDETTLYSNLAIAYNLSGLYSEAIASANMALELLQRCARSDAIVSKKEKIVFNLIKALCAQANSLLEQNDHQSAFLHRTQAQQMISTHQEILKTEVNTQVSMLIQGLEKNFTAFEVTEMLLPSPSQDNLVSNSIFQEKDEMMDARGMSMNEEQQGKNTKISSSFNENTSYVSKLNPKSKHVFFRQDEESIENKRTNLLSKARFNENCSTT